MVELNKLIAKSRTTEIDTVTRDIITGYDKNGTKDDANLAGLIDELRPVSAELTGAVKRKKAESELEEKDEIRDTKVKGVFHIKEGCLCFSDKKINSAAVMLDGVLNRYGMGITRESYAVESSLVKSLIGDFAKPEIQKATGALPGMSQIIEELKAAQDDFEKTSLNYKEDKSDEEELKSATEIKMQAVSIINDKLVVYLRAMCMINKEKYGGYAGTVAQMIDDNNAAVKRRNNNGGDTDKE